MAQPYVGEIRIFAGNFAPLGWAFCNGATIAIAENDTLFTLIGTTYGGDGQETFNLPDLQGRFPVHMGTGAGLSTYVIGEVMGSETVTLTTNQMASHTHTPVGNGTAGDSPTPSANVWGTNTDGLQYTDAAPNAAMNTAALTPAGGNQPHENMPPFLGVSFIISLFGIYPSPT